MAYRITKVCISCGICIELCPNKAVYVTRDDIYAIDPRRCTECVDLPRRRCEDICSVGAITPDPSNRETAPQRWAKHRSLHPFRVDDLLSD